MNKPDFSMSKSNSLIVAILDILKNNDEPIGEHQLIVELRLRMVELPNHANKTQLALFQTHFLVMNALYQLQQQWLEEGLYLFISSLLIELRVLNSASSNSLSDVMVNTELRDYYLDLSHVENTSVDEVGRLRNSFWQYYAADDKKYEAYATLDLSPQASWAEVRQRYRRKVAENHPDRGGDADEFMLVRKAYELLSHIHQHQ